MVFSKKTGGMKNVAKYFKWVSGVDGRNDGFTNRFQIKIVFEFWFY